MLKISFKNRSRIYSIIVFNLIVLLIISNVLLASSVNNSKDSVKTTTSKTFSTIWSTDNGTVLKYIVSPIVTDYQTGNSYIFNITIKCLGLPPNASTITALNTSLLLYNTHKNIFTIPYYFNNITKVGQVETQFVTLDIPQANNLSLNTLSSLNGELYYHLHFNETFANFNDTFYETGWKMITAVSIKTVSQTTYSFLSFLLIGGIITLIVLAVIFYSKRQTKKRLKQGNQQQQGFNNQSNLNNGILRYPNNQESQNNFTQQQYQQQPPMYQPPQQFQPTQQYQPVNQQIVYQPEFISKKLLLSQKLKVCKNCSSLNLDQMSHCYLCNSLLNESSNQDEFDFSNKFLPGFKTYIILVLIGLAIEMLVGLSISSLYQLTGHDTYIPLLDGKLDKSTPAYQAWYHFMLPVGVLTSFIIVILFNVIPYFILKRDILLSNDLTISKIKSFKNFFIILPALNILYVSIFGALLSGGISSLNYDFFIYLAAMGLIIGFMAFPFRLWIYFRKFVVTRDILVYLANSQILQQPRNDRYRPQITPTQTMEFSKSQILAEQSSSFIICSNCNNEIEKTSLYCPECGIIIERCNICKMPFNLNDEKSYCPYCKNSFHLGHLRERIKISGSCPSCQQPLQDFEILKEKY